MTRNSPTPSPAGPPKKERLLTFWSGGWVILLSAVFTLAAAVWGVYPVLKTKFAPAVGDGQNVDSYQFDLRTCLVPRERIVAAGVAKDQIRAIAAGRVDMISPDEVTRIREREHVKFLVSSDCVIGLFLGNTARAYPLRVLVQHEVVNDVVGGVPVAVTYSPLCDSVVVFDRRIAGDTVEFGVSGLLYNSNPLFFDRQGDPKRESLWSQLLFQAVAGPAAEKKLALTRVDHLLTDWGSWKAAHPDTLVLAGEPAFRQLYLKEPYGTYFNSDALKFPAEPAWDTQRSPRKTPIVALPGADGKWTVHPSGTLGAGAVESFIFAWYAMRPDSDFSAALPKPQ